MKLWIRVDASAPVDPKMGQLADTLRVQRAHAFGLVAGVWCAMAAHAVDGDLSQVSDRSLEEWAGWTGRRGVFASAFRAQFLDADSQLGGWTERQGKLLDRMERDRKRHQKPNDPPPDPPRKDSGNSAEVLTIVPGNSTSTERNGTVRTTKALSDAHASEPKNWVAEATEMWCSAIGEADHGHIGRYLKGAVDRHGWPVVKRALAEYAGTPSKTKAPKYFANEIVRWIAEADEPLERDGVLTDKGRRLMEIA